ncbi:SDR family NAD(P)-dependent oxidoreductase [Capillimicrobium parvum]|uniref:Oxidoreductase n=1 Tax=Capillimicrobium parvum TaxID=2884022 RepID=A0A9E6XZE2_9ACTN|nr:SDR family oxidoreductase [Capillimicrobium parvum]UGS37284.1 putative oxidoreductase [Capillimicrobium parvum]
MRELDGQVAIVTGAARGLGRAIAVALGKAGAVVYGADLSDCAESAAAVEAAGGTFASRSVDATDQLAAARVVDDIIGERGRVDVLVNNAGRWIDLARRPFWEIPVDEYDAVMAVNARSVFVMSRAVSEPMRRARSGRIVNFTSATVSFGMPDLIHYVAAKAAIVGLTRSMARELGPFGVACNAVSPGLVPTDAGRAVMPAEWYDEVIGTQLLEGAITPEDIAACVRFLAGPGARMITGEIVNVSAGSTMGAT